MSEACCTCATLYSSMTPVYDEKPEKPLQSGRRLECCGRSICGRCLLENRRFKHYCPFCQIANGPSPLPAQGLRDPPAYSPPNPSLFDGGSPSGSSFDVQHSMLEKTEKHSGNAPDVLHFVDQDKDSISSLSLRYSIPTDVLRRVNNLYADHLLAARKTILIPGQFYKGGVSLSPRPLGGEEEEVKKTKVRKFMVRCKVVEYDVALLYLDQANYILEEAIGAYRADEQWEREHSLEAAKEGKSRASGTSGRRKWGFGGLTGQLS